MTYDLYADVFFLVNFTMDVLVLMILGKVLNMHATVQRIALGAAIGAAWAVFTVIFPVLPGILEMLLTYVGISSVMVKVSFGTRGVRDTVKAVAGLYLTAASLGGVIYALYQHTRAGYYIELLARGKLTEAMPACIFILLAFGCFFGVRFLWHVLAEEKRRRSHLFRVTLHYQGKEKTVTGFMDTGNQLYEPVSHTPVHILTYEACCQMCSHVTAVIYVPFQSVGTEQGVLPAIYFDSMEVEQDSRHIVVEKPLIAIYRAALSPSGEYQMLLHEET